MFTLPRCRVAAVGGYEQERDRILREFGLNLAKLRPKGISQEGFARKAGVHRNEIGALERGEREPGLLMLLILTKATGVSVERLVQDLPIPAERKPRPQAERDAASD
jgi:transcriptional regulator with XRE-family HTH domain